MITFRIDEDAHKKIKKTKHIMHEKGIENPTNSDAIRYLYRNAKINEGKKSILDRFKISD